MRRCGASRMITTIFFEQRFDSGAARRGLDLEQTAHLVLDISSNLDQLGGCPKKRMCISTLRAFDVCLSRRSSEEIAEWQSRPTDVCYPLVFFDAIRVKNRDEGFVRNKAVYIALGIRPDGTKEILGIWIEQTEGAKFWLRVMNKLKNRGIGDILIASSMS
jgi:mutator family transposase